MAGKYKQLTPAEWAQIVAKFELGTGGTVNDLAEEFGVHPNTIRRGLNDRGVKKGSRAHEIGQVTTDAAKDARRLRLDAIEKMKDRYGKYNDFLSRLIMQKIQKQIADNKSVADIKEEIRTLKDAALAVGKTRDENFHILGLYNDDIVDDELPEIAISEYTPEELESLQQRFEDQAEAALKAEESGAGLMPFADDDD